ncbi:MAG: hypothetical protein JWO00_98 [Candidatus Parcubacteria bacterium]|nr:hypothetical protein [Candidatus Parcubacteria bacterium]
MNSITSISKDSTASARKAPKKQLPPVPRERLTHQVQRSPYLDWLIILGVSVSIALVLVGVGVSVYLGTGARLSAPSSNTPRSTKAAFSAAVLQQTLADSDARAAEAAALSKSYSAPKDPSLP